MYYFRQMHPKLNQTKASLSVGCVPAEQERRDISQIAQNALHKIEQLFRKNLAIPLALMYNGLDLKGRMFKNTLPYAAADDLKGGTWDVV